MAAKSKFGTSAKTWLRWEARARYETGKYTLLLSDLTQDELLTLSPITQDMVDFAPQMFHAIAPRQHPKLKRVISYLAELHERQNEAWANFLAKCEQEAQEVNSQLF